METPSPNPNYKFHWTKREHIQAIELIRSEREKQSEKWGQQRHNSFRWLAILTEEIGEFCAAYLKGNYNEAFRELVQVCAVAVAWLEHAVLCVDEECGVIDNADPEKPMEKPLDSA